MTYSYVLIHRVKMLQELTDGSETQCFKMRNLKTKVMRGEDPSINDNKSRIENFEGDVSYLGQQ